MEKTLFVATSMLCVPVLAGDRLTEDELAAFCTDRTLIVTNHRPGPGKTDYAGDGQVISRQDGGKERVGT